MRTLLLLASVFLPQFLKQAVLRRLGWTIGREVTIGWSLVHARKVVIGDGVTIGHGNVIRNLRVLRLGAGAKIGNLNNIFGASRSYPDYTSTFIMGERASLTSRHFIDSSGMVEIGRDAVIGGRGIQIWSHALHPAQDGFAMREQHIHVGEGAFVAARAMLLAGFIPPGAVVAAGSVVTRSFAPEPARLLIGGNPAEVRKRYDPEQFPARPARIPPERWPLSDEDAYITPI